MTYEILNTSVKTRMKESVSNKRNLLNKKISKISKIILTKELFRKFP